MVRICMHIVKYNIKKWKQNYNILLGLIYLLIISDMMFRPARKIVEQLGFSPNISSFSFRPAPRAARRSPPRRRR